MNEPRTIEVDDEENYDRMSVVCPTKDAIAVSGEFRAGAKITDVRDVNRLQLMVIQLWSLLDDIDTLDDVCKTNVEAFRGLTRVVQTRRHATLVSDGYSLFLPYEDNTQ